MSGLIRVTPEELRAMAKQYGVESQEVMNQVDRLNRMISDLKGMWEGASSEAFADQYGLTETFIY